MYDAHIVVERHYTKIEKHLKQLRHVNFFLFEFLIRRAKRGIKMTSTHVNQLHLLQQNLQNILLQKQQFSVQLAETESALQEIPNSSSTYKIVGKLMIAKETSELTRELEEQLKLIKLRITTIEKQESALKSSIEKVQQEMLEEMKTEEKRSEE